MRFVAMGVPALLIPLRVSDAETADTGVKGSGRGGWSGVENVGEGVVYATCTKSDETARHAELKALNLAFTQQSPGDLSDTGALLATYYKYGRRESNPCLMLGKHASYH